MKSLTDILSPVLDRLRGGPATIAVSELSGSSRALFLLSLHGHLKRPLLVITPDEESASALTDDLRFFSRQAGIAADDRDHPDAASLLTLPSWGLLPFEPDSPDSSTVGERMRVLYELLSGNVGILTASVTDVLQKLPPWQRVADSVSTISPGLHLDPDNLSEGLIGIGYESVSLVTRIGEFSRRGGIIDVFSPAHDNPLRLEFFGDTVESLRSFDPENQRSIHALEQAVILPVRELLLTPTDHESAQKDHDGRVWPRICQELKEGRPVPGAEFLAPFCYEMDALVRYLPQDAVVVVIEPEEVEHRAAAYWQKILDGRAEEEAQGRDLPEAEALYLPPEDLQQTLEPCSRVTISLLSTDEASLPMDVRSTASLSVRLTRVQDKDSSSDQTVEGSVPSLVAKLKGWRRDHRVLIVCGSDESRSRTASLFSEYGLDLAGEIVLEGPPWPVSALTGRLSGGFHWPALGLIIITDEEIFGPRSHAARPPARRSKAAPFLSTFRELRPGDFVVHRDYGVGEYRGLTHISVEGFETDYLTLRYEPDATLHVPLYSLDKVQKYVGVEGRPPRLDRLGAPQWSRVKERVRKDILEMARGLIAIYAAREAQERPAFSPPDTLYREFEAAFPYEETPDQQRTIVDVLSDMQRPRPMDRVVCGDVGFGKTEVALRAAFKAVEDGLQAAVLVPTTLLADQHFRNFTERLAPFSVRVDLLSRFRTRAEQAETLKGLKRGTVDIVIGTHRLLQKDVSFRNLGLLIVDEEHRFGVRHKERIKEMKKLVDVLTLTATPIPRTLHMSLAGIRDLSIIQTPPLDRQSIQVILARFGQRVIREAIEREISRAGQVFFVHNRVQGIDRIADHLRALVPQARIGVAHGQMKEDQMEQVMSDFIAGRLNVLVTTTIIESGIDIPTANTIIINRADRFGLAELYQIKGRVGRSREKAYAYLLTPAEEALSDVARKRLRAIQELSELGAGFRIAAQDLETRGAGNLLGRQQSGHIAAVGIDLYTQMMEEALAELRGEERREETETSINLRASAFIPDDYIADPSLRLAAYKEISGVTDDAGIHEVSAGIADRYGPLPEPLANLLEIMSLRIAARDAGLVRVDGGGKSVSITFGEGAAVSPDRVMALLKANRGRVTFVPEYTLKIVLSDDSLSTTVRAVKKCLQELR